MLGTPPSPSHFDRLAAEIGGDLGGPGPVMDRFWAEIEGQLDTLSPEVLSVDTASAVCTAVRASGSGRSSSPAVRPASLPRPERRRRHRSLPAGLNKNLYDRMRESIKIFFQNTSFDCQACRTRRHQNRCLVCRCERPVRPCTCRPASGGDAALVPDGATWTCCPTCQPESCAGVSGLACEAEARVLGGLISCAHCAEESGADAVAESVRRLLLNMRDFLLDLARFVDATRTPCVATDEDRRCLAGHGLEATTTSGAAVTQAQVAYLRAAAGSFDAATYRALGRTPAPLQPGFVAASRRALVLRTYARPAGWTLLPPSICGTYDAAALDDADRFRAVQAQLKSCRVRANSNPFSHGKSCVTCAHGAASEFFQRVLRARPKKKRGRPRKRPRADAPPESRPPEPVTTVSVADQRTGSVEAAPVAVEAAAAVPADTGAADAGVPVADAVPLSQLPATAVPVVVVPEPVVVAPDLAFEGGADPAHAGLRVLRWLAKHAADPGAPDLACAALARAGRVGEAHALALVLLSPGDPLGMATAVAAVFGTSQCRLNSAGLRRIELDARVRAAGATVLDRWLWMVGVVADTLCAGWLRGARTSPRRDPMWPLLHAEATEEQRRRACFDVLESVPPVDLGPQVLGGMSDRVLTKAVRRLCPAAHRRIAAIMRGIAKSVQGAYRGAGGGRGDTARLLADAIRGPRSVGPVLTAPMGLAVLEAVAAGSADALAIDEEWVLTRMRTGMRPVVAMHALRRLKLLGWLRAYTECFKRVKMPCHCGPGDECAGCPCVHAVELSERVAPADLVRRRACASGLCPFHSGQASGGLFYRRSHRFAGDLTPLGRVHLCEAHARELAVAKACHRQRLLVETRLRVLVRQAVPISTPDHPLFRAVYGFPSGTTVRPPSADLDTSTHAPFGLTLATADAWMGRADLIVRTTVGSTVVVAPGVAGVAQKPRRGDGGVREDMAMANVNYCQAVVCAYADLQRDMAHQRATEDGLRAAAAELRSCKAHVNRIPVRGRDSTPVRMLRRLSKDRLAPFVPENPIAVPLAPEYRAFAAYVDGDPNLRVPFAPLPEEEATYDDCQWARMDYAGAGLPVQRVRCVSFMYRLPRGLAGLVPYALVLRGLGPAQAVRSQAVEAGTRAAVRAAGGTRAPRSAPRRPPPRCPCSSPTGRPSPRRSWPCSPAPHDGASPVERIAGGVLLCEGHHRIAGAVYCPRATTGAPHTGTTTRYDTASPPSTVPPRISTSVPGLKAK